MLQIELDGLEEIGFDVAAFGLDEIQLPELEEVEPAAKSNRKKTTLFISIKNQDVEKARTAIILALNKAKIEHNL